MSHEKDYTISYFDGTLPEFNETSDAEISRIAIIDLQSKGKNPKSAKLVELAVVVLEIDRDSCKPLKVVEQHHWFQDPEEEHELSEGYTKMTGITQEMVQGKSIDSPTMEAIIDTVDVFVAYNAGYVRPILEEQFPSLESSIFACVRNQIEWTVKGHECRSLSHLCRDHRWYNDGLRMNERCAVVIKLLSEGGADGENYLEELISRAEEPLITIEAKVQMRQKHLMKKERFRWDPRERAFLRCMGSSSLEKVKRSLESRGFRGELIERDRIPASERFK